MSYELNEYQKKILDTYLNTDDNLYISAKAGTGKTSTLLELSKYFKGKNVFLAFNKSIQQEISKKVEDNMKVYTFNGIGFMILNFNQNDNKKLTIDTFKVYKIVHQVIEKYLKSLGGRIDYGYFSFLKDGFCQLYNLARSRYIDMSNIEDVKAIINIYKLFDNDDYNLPSNIIRLLNDIDNEDFRMYKEDNIIDFTDQVYLVVKCVLNREENFKLPYYCFYDNVAVDECLTGNTIIKCKDKNKKISNIYKMFKKEMKLPLVKSYNHFTKEWEYKKIKNVWKHNFRKVYTIKLKNYFCINATSNHKFFTNRGYVKVEDLIQNKDKIMGDNGNWYTVDKVIYKCITSVYDVEIEDNHNFVCLPFDTKYEVEGILSHNCQDLNKMQQIFLNFIKKKTGRYIFVLDEKQAIYGFSGADSKSYETIKRMFKPIELDLPINYRCGRKHLQYINKLYNIGIKPNSESIDGEIYEINENEIYDKIQIGDYIITRKNATLCKIVISLLEKGLPIYVKDSELVKKIIDFIKKTKTSTVTELRTAMNRTRAKVSKKFAEQMDKMEKEGSADKDTIDKYNIYNPIIDIFEAVFTLLNNYSNKYKELNINKFIQYIQVMLNTTNPKGCVVCTSIHQVKGLESDNVFLVGEMPTITPFQTKDEIQQEKNLHYIALSRAKKNLYLVKEMEGE